MKTLTFITFSLILLNLNWVNAQKPIETLGIFHNNGLDYAKSKKSQIKNVEGAIAITNEYLSKTEGWTDLSIPGSVASVMEELLSRKHSSYSLAIDMMQSKIAGIEDLNPYFQFFQDLGKILTKNYGNSKNLIKQGLLEALDALKVKTRDDEMQGAIEISIASTNYWTGEADLEDGDVQAIIQLDAAGYIIGWIDAVLEDYNSEEGVTAEGGWDRMRRAFKFGMGFSVLRFVP
jgi:hypothetical protein